MAEITYRVANSTENDFMKKLDFDTKLNTFLNPSYQPPSKDALTEQFRVFTLTNNTDRFVVFAELENEVIGYIYIENFYIFGKGNIDYSSANINDIFVLPSHRTGIVALKLLHHAIDILNKKGINKGILNVQTHNKFRFLHYAICDEVISSEYYTRSNGQQSCTKTLAIHNLQELRNKPLREILKAKRFHQKNFEENGIERE